LLGIARLCSFVLGLGAGRLDPLAEHVLVVTADEGMAHWSVRPIELGGAIASLGALTFSFDVLLTFLTSLPGLP
jgi:hypothetical protein